MATTTVGEIQLIAKIDTSQYNQDAKNIEKANDNIETSADNTSKKANVAFQSIAKVGLAAVATTAVAVGVAITKNIGNAIGRIDTLVAFPRVLQALGSTTEEAETATKTLSDKLRGLPTSLQAGARGVQGLVTAGLGVPKATDAFLGLNNALLVAGGGTAQAESAMLQLQQALSRGRIEGQEWNTIAASMPTVMQALSNETGKTKDELREMFRTDPQALVDNIIRLNKEGGGGLSSLDKQAREATGGINTAFENMNNAITRGIEGIVRSIGDGGTDQEKLISGQKKISDAITSVGEAFGVALGVIGDFTARLSKNKTALSVIAGVIGGTLLAGVVLLGNAIWVALAPLLPFIAAFALLGAVVGLVIQNWDKIKPAIDIVINAFKVFWDAIAPIRDFIANQFKAAWDDLKGAFDRVKTALEPFLPQLKSLGVILAAVLLIPLLFIIGVFVTFVATIIGVITIVARLIGWIAMLGAMFLEATLNIQRSVREKVGDVIQFFKDLPGKIHGALGNVGRMLYDAGKSIFQGLIDGMKAIGDKVKDTASNIVESVRNLLPFSPAKEGPFSGKGWTLYSGQSLMKGFADGITKASGLPQQALSNALSDFSEPLTGRGAKEFVIPKEMVDQNTGLPKVSNNSQTINQYNTINNNVDFDVVNRNLAWRLSRA